MTLKELAEQLNRPVRDVIKSLKQNGFKGIYKDTHVIPDEAVEIVKVTIIDGENTLQSLPSANINQSGPEAHIQQQDPATPGNDGLTQLKERVENSFNAVSEARQHIGVNGYQQEIDNKALAGVVTALAGQASYNEAYLKTVGMLYGRDIQDQQKAINSVLNTITNPDFFGQQTPGESYYKLSGQKTSNSLLQQAMSATEELTN